MPEVTIAEVRRFMEDCMLAVGTPEGAAKAHVDLLLHADIVGHYSHGLNRLGFYINDILAGSTQVNATPVVLKQSAASAWVDGCDALGATVGHFCVDLAMKKAREAGIAIVTAQHSNHYGMAGYWAIKAEKEGLIGMAFTNTSPILVPTRAKYAALGTNPLAMAAPAENGDSLVVDMAATAVALGKIEVQIHKGEDIPLGWAMDSEGKITTDANKAFAAGRLLPLGGVEETSGYKGYALSAMVEVLCSGLSAAKPTHKIRTWDLNPPDSVADPPNLGQCFIVIDPSHFAPGFAGRMADCLAHWRGMEPVDPSLPVLAPGDKERMNAQKTADRGTISYSQGQIDTCLALAKRIGAKPIQIL